MGQTDQLPEPFIPSLPLLLSSLLSFAPHLTPSPLLACSICCLPFSLLSPLLPAFHQVSHFSPHLSLPPSWPRSPAPPGAPSLQAGLWVLQQPPVGVGALPDMPFRAWETAGQTFWLHCHCLPGCSVPLPRRWISIRIPRIPRAPVSSAAGLFLLASSFS